MLLQELNEGQEGAIDHFLNEELAVKLMAMGVLPGSRVRVVRRAGAGNTLYIKVDQLHLAIRKKEAACIVLKPSIP
ncbi:MAG: ferrous iron transport protein A [Saprospiraceae bacterium]|nr:ferrous iron transport protein A [Saprospiraceae bacterium]MCB0624815.1 ferrous iron transport protein A [Saprospiraceae bacterium]MCB0676193.1 ferrous iron transport protein A [Saprospiraceae bacterium]MCB0681547.1 ferrous iron transport protein A [Saprospiraceae bacterium]